MIDYIIDECRLENFRGDDFWMMVPITTGWDLVVEKTMTPKECNEIFGTEFFVYEDVCGVFYD